MIKIILACTIHLFLVLTVISGEKDLIQNFKLLTSNFKNEAESLSRKDLLLKIKQPNLSILIDLKAGQQEDYYKVLTIQPEEGPLYQFLDNVLKNSNLFYHIDNNSLIIGSEWYWLTKENIYQNEYDISGIYNKKDELKALISKVLEPFDIVKCKYEINFINSRQCAITGNKYIHFYLKQFFNAIRNPIYDFDDASNQLISSAELYFNNKLLKTIPATLSAEEWLKLVGQLNSEAVIFNNEITRKNLKSKLIKVDKEDENIGVLLSKIKLETKENIYYQKGRGIFFNQDNMIKLTPIQKVKFRIYNVKQFTGKLNGNFICQNIKDEIQKEIWVYPENQVIYHQHLEQIIVIAPPLCFAEIDLFFYQLKKK